MRMSEVRKDVLGKDIYFWRQIFAVLEDISTSCKNYKLFVLHK